jgi:uncharacterized protein (TIGR03083 family)
VEYADFIDAIEREASALAAAARSTSPDTPVPSCPGWTMQKLVRHTGSAFRWSSTVLETRRAVGPEGVDRRVPDAVEDYPEWLEASAAGLADTLRHTDPGTGTWAWGADQHARFWARRMAHEAAIHRWDAQLAAGDPEPLDGELAVDGIDELIDNAPFHPSVAALQGSGETIHAHAIDREGEWLFCLDPSGLIATREHAKGDVALRGTASDLSLVLHGRLPPSAVETFGDTALLERWQADVRL